MKSEKDISVQRHESTKPSVVERKPMSYRKRHLIFLAMFIVQGAAFGSEGSNPVLFSRPGPKEIKVETAGDPLSEDSIFITSVLIDTLDGTNNSPQSKTGTFSAKYPICSEDLGHGQASVVANIKIMGDINLRVHVPVYMIILSSAKAWGVATASMEGATVSMSDARAKATTSGNVTIPLPSPIGSITIPYVVGSGLTEYSIDFPMVRTWSGEPHAPKTIYGPKIAGISLQGKGETELGGFNSDAAVFVNLYAEKNKTELSKLEIEKAK